MSDVDRLDVILDDQQVGTLRETRGPLGFSRTEILSMTSCFRLDLLEPEGGN